MKLAKGYFGRRKNVWTVAKNAVEKAMEYAYRDRETRKEISAHYGFSVSTQVHESWNDLFSIYGKVKANEIELNRKVLADLAMNHPDAFKAIVEKVK